MIQVVTFAAGSMFCQSTMPAKLLAQQCSCLWKFYDNYHNQSILYRPHVDTRWKLLYLGMGI